MALFLGARLGVYEIVGALGAGGMGEVYSARDTRLDRLVAVKVLRPDIALDDPGLARDRWAVAVALFILAVDAIDRGEIAKAAPLAERSGAPVWRGRRPQLIVIMQPEGPRNRC